MIRKATRAILSAAMTLGLVASAGTVASAGAAEAEERYTIDAKIMAVRADDLIRMHGESIEMRPSQG